MTKSVSPRKSRPRRGTFVAIGAGCLLALSLLVSVAYGAGAADPSLMASVTTSDSLTTIWTLAVGAVALTLLWVWGRIWGKAWAVSEARRAAPHAGPGLKLAQSGLAAVLVAAVAIGPAAWAASAVSANAPQNDQWRQVILAAAPACKGQTPVAGTHGYEGDTHPVEVISASTSTGGAWTGEQADVSVRAGDLGPLPGTLDSVQLVACIGERTETVVETCDYSPSGTYTRYRYSRSVSIYSARTGQLLGGKTLAGSEAGECPKLLMINGAREEHGDDVNWDDSGIWDYVKTWVSGPVKSPGPTDSPAS